MSETVLRGGRRKFLEVAAVVGLGLSPFPGADAEAQDLKDCIPRDDFPKLARYAAENASIAASEIRPHLVLMGDSITENWQRFRPNFFSNKVLCRGIGGQTTQHMLLRTMSDVVALRPNRVHILAGTNDVAGNGGAITAAQTCDNIEAMATIARAAGIKVAIASIPPAASFPWRPGNPPAQRIRDLNVMLEKLSGKVRATWIDYHSALADGAGAMRGGLSSDGVHPINAGYAIMEEVLLSRMMRE